MNEIEIMLCTCLYAVCVPTLYRNKTISLPLYMRHITPYGIWPIPMTMTTLPPWSVTMILILLSILTIPFSPSVLMILSPWSIPTTWAFMFPYIGKRQSIYLYGCSLWFRFIHVFIRTSRRFQIFGLSFFSFFAAFGLFKSQKPFRSFFIYTHRAT